MDEQNQTPNTLEPKNTLEFLSSPQEITEVFGDNKELALFFMAWLNNGQNATKAYLSLHPEVTEASARVLGSRQLAKVNIRVILESYGLGVEKYFHKLIDGLEAERWNAEVKDYEPDWRARRPYHEALGRLLGIEKGNKDSSMVIAVNQNNSKYKYHTAEELKAAILERIRKKGQTNLAEPNDNNQILE